MQTECGLCLQCGPKQTLVRALSIRVGCPLVLLFTQVLAGSFSHCLCIDAK